MNMKEKVYTIYLRKTDQRVASGTVEECAEQMGKTRKGFISMLSKVKTGKISKFRVVSEIIESNE